MKIKEYENFEFYVSKTDKNRVYAEYVIEPQSEHDSAVLKFADVDSKEFKSYLNLAVVENSEKSADEIIERIHDYHNVYGSDDVVCPKVRTAGKLRDGRVEYALYDRQNHVIVIQDNGYKIKKDSENKFLQQSTNATQVFPEETDRTLQALMRPYVSTSQDHFILFLVWLVQAVCEGNHSLLLIIAKAGCGKSTLTKNTRDILDPSNIDVCRTLKRGDGLITTLTNSYVVTFDNMRELTKDESDTLCTAITGGTYSKREAYTTNGLSVFNLHNTVIINGVDVWPEESDLAQRCLCLPLESVEEKRVSDTELSRNFKRDLPKILHCIFNTISIAMRVIKDISPKRKPRMLDSYEEMLAIAIALGVTEEKFEDIYFKNIEYIDKLRANDDLIFAIREYFAKHCNGKRSFEGYASDIYSKIRNAYSGSKSALPGSASHFSRKLKAEYSMLQASGFTVNIDDTNEDGTYIKIIKNKT